MSEPDLSSLRERHLVEPGWLEERLNDPSIRVVDMRGYVRTRTDDDGVQSAEYMGAREEYAQGHIPGAVYLDWTTDIVDLDDPVPAQVAGPEKIARVLGAACIGDDTLVIAYDNHPASQFATRLWWVLRYYGHENVRVLNGGMARWQAEGHPLSAEIPPPAAATFTPRVRSELRKTAEQVLAETSACVVDARDEGQYTGRIRRGPRGGHIPGAVHLPREALFTAGGAFKEPKELREAVDTAGIPADRPVIAYCNGGVAATSVLFALSMLGRADGANYDGSWNEWTRRMDLPVSSGPNPD